MKILLITQNFYPELGSASNRLGVIFKLLNKSDYDTYVLTTQPTYPYQNLYNDSEYYNDSELNSLDKTKIFRLKTKVKKQNKSFIKRTMYFLEEFINLRLFLSIHNEKYDYIYVTTPNIFLAWGTLFFKKKDTKYILEVRDLWPDSANAISGLNIKSIMPILKFLEKRMYNSADKIVINNLYFKDHIESILKTPKPILYLPNAIKKSELIPINKNKDFTVIYTGNVGHAQDVSKLLQVAKSLNENKIHFKAIVYGAHVQLFKKESAHLEYLNVLDPIPRSECLIEISKAHVALSLLKPSEVFLNVLPGKIIDAIGMGTIPITNLGGFTEQLINNHNLGFAKENMSVDEVVKNINFIKDNVHIRNQMTNNSISYRNENLIWDNNIKNLETFLLDGEMDEY